MTKIIIRLKANRDFIGKLDLYKKSNVLVTTFNAFGRADISKAASKGNPTASSLLPFGHTPTGKYSNDNIIVNSGPGTHFNNNSYGPKGIIPLTPVSGNASTAKTNGRTGLAIHGGELGAQGKLRPTNGCIRLSNQDMETLVNQTRFLLMSGDPIEFIEVREEQTSDNIAGDLLAQSNDPDPFVV